MDIVVMIFLTVDGGTRVCLGQPGGDAYTSTWHARIAIAINRYHQNPRKAVECRCGSRPRCDKSLINMLQGSVLNLDTLAFRASFNATCLLFRFQHNIGPV
jgi:hypothetical protein